MIGIYDSGLGGLAVLRYLRERMPKADLLYLGDTVHLPYGEKPPALLQKYAESAVSFFRHRRVSVLLVACGTVSTVVLESAPPKADFPIIGVARPAVERLRRLGCKRIAVLGTAATIKSGGFERLLSELNAEILPLSCPHLVPTAERGDTAPSLLLTRLVRQELQPLFAFSPNAILLGCTHFPLFSETIAELFPSCALIDCGRAAADLLDPAFYGDGSGKEEYCVTGSAEHFRQVSKGILPGSSSARVHQIDLKTNR